MLKIIPITLSKKADPVTQIIFQSFVDFKTKECIMHWQAKEVKDRFPGLAEDFMKKNKGKIIWERELLKLPNPGNPNLYIFGSDFEEDLFTIWGTHNLWGSIVKEVFEIIPVIPANCVDRPIGPPNSA